MSLVRKMLVLNGAFVLGWLLGPAFFAAASSLNALSDKASHSAATYRLLSAFDDYYPQPILMPSMDFGIFVRECGYHEESLFGANDELAEGQSWSPRTGYFDLIIWHHDEFEREIEKRRADALGKHFGDYQLAFLDKCIRQTAFASFCGQKIRRVLERGNLLSQSSLPYDQPDVDQRRRTQSICIYLDGIAARNGQPLAQRARETFEKPPSRQDEVLN